MCMLTHMCEYVYVYICLYMCICVCVYTCTCMCICVCTGIQVHVSVCACFCVGAVALRGQKGASGHWIEVPDFELPKGSAGKQIQVLCKIKCH